MYIYKPNRTTYLKPKVLTQLVITTRNDTVHFNYAWQLPRDHCCGLDKKFLSLGWLTVILKFIQSAVNKGWLNPSETLLSPSQRLHPSLWKEPAASPGIQITERRKALLTGPVQRWFDCQGGSNPNVGRLACRAPDTGRLINLYCIFLKGTAHTQWLVLHKALLAASSPWSVVPPDEGQVSK